MGTNKTSTYTSSIGTNFAFGDIPPSSEHYLRTNDSIITLNKSEEYSFKDITDEINAVMHSVIMPDSARYSINAVRIVVPDKVLEVSFNNGVKIKTVVKPPDTFDPEQGLYIALAKMLYGHTYTFEGIEHKAEEMKYQKEYVKIVHDGMKLYKQEIENRANKEREEEERQRIAANRKAKRERRKQKKEQEMIAQNQARENEITKYALRLFDELMRREQHWEDKSGDSDE